MFSKSEKIRKNIVTPDGEDEFQIRYIRDENVGLVTTRSEKSYLILDSIDYWYDLIQEQYPAKKKCGCKNDRFKLYFDYVPRIGTDDYRAVEIYSCCTKCGKNKRLAEIDIDYSPTQQLFETPIMYCEKPKIKYKTYSISGFWQEEGFRNLIDFLTQKQLQIYCWYWDKSENKRVLSKFSSEELKKFLFEDKNNYLSIYFSIEALDDALNQSVSNVAGVVVDRNLWRKYEAVELDSPVMVASASGGYFYSMNFCSEYLQAGEVKAKSKLFSRLVKEIVDYCKENLN